MLVNKRSGFIADFIQICRLAALTRLDGNVDAAIGYDKAIESYYRGAATYGISEDDMHEIEESARRVGG